MCSPSSLPCLPSRPLTHEVKNADFSSKAYLIPDYTAIHWGLHYCRQGQGDKAQRKLETALMYFTRMQDEVGIGKSLNGLSTLYFSEGNYGRSLACSQAAAAILATTAARADYGLAVCQLGQSYAQLGQMAEAERQLETALAVSHDQGDRDQEDCALLHLGQVYAAQAKYLFALACYESVLDSVLKTPLREHGREMLQTVLEAMMQLCLQTQQGATAVERFQKILAEHVPQQHYHQIAPLLQHLTSRSTETHPLTGPKPVY